VVTKIGPVTQPLGPALSLRSREVQRTRAALIDAAVELCLSRGYENATIEHIANAADVSARTFSRYFRNKDAVFVALLDDLAEDVARELHALPADLGPLESMRAALGAVLTRAHTAGFSSGSADRITRIINVVTSSDTLRQAAVDYRGPQVVQAMAQRMNVAVDDRHLALAMVIISVTVVHAWADLAASKVDLQPLLIAKHVDQAFADLGTYAADLTPGKPPRSPRID
jgi:AcrR family transcriptional regulator